MGTVIKREMCGQVEVKDKKTRRDTTGWRESLNPLLLMGTAEQRGPANTSMLMVPVEGSGVSRVLKHGGCST